MTLQAGDEAPNFQLPDQFGDIHELISYRGGWVLLYFYPKDGTSGCTAEACAFRDNYRDFKQNEISVVGVSVDSVASHQEFVEKYDLPFTVLADTDKQAVSLYGVLQPKKNNGKSHGEARRQSFLINPSGLIEKIYPDVAPEMHAAEVLADVEALKN